MAVKKNANGVWYFKIYVTDEFGKKRQIKRENKEWSRSDARLEEAKLIQNNTIDSSMQLRKLAELYFKHKELSLKESSLHFLQTQYKHMIEPYFGDVRIDRIDNKMIMTWQRIMLDKGYSNSSLGNGQGTLKAILEHGVKCNFLLKNPYTIDHVKNNLEVKHEVQVISVLDFNKLLTVIDNPEHIVLYKVLYWVGLRIGEALALTVNDIDFENNTIRVSKTYNDRLRKSTSPKTKSSSRVIKMNQTVREVLEDYIKFLSMAYGFSGESYIFGFHTPYCYSTLKNYHKRYCKEAGLPYFKFHVLRHSCVSILISLGVKPLQIAKRMGHSVDMVNSVYGHMFPDDDQLIADQQDNLQSKIDSRMAKSTN